MTLGSKPGKVGGYISSINRTGKYMKIYVIKLYNGFYNISDRYNRFQALRNLGYQTVKIFIAK